MPPSSFASTASISTGILSFSLLAVTLMIAVYALAERTIRAEPKSGLLPNSSRAHSKAKRLEGDFVRVGLGRLGFVSAPFSIAR
jgi:hypothetical protein